MMKMISIVICALGISMVASANHERMHEGPCKADVEAYCKDVTPGGGAIIKCLKDNEAKLKPECVAHLKAAKEAMKDVKEACHEDFEKFCHDTKPGRGRVMKCMKEHKAELSEGCKNEIEEKKAAHKK